MSREVHKAIDEQRALQRLVNALTAGLSADSAGPDWLADTTAKFEHLRAHLIKHFALEESAGFMRLTLERRPDKSADIIGFQNDHSELTVAVNDLWSSLKSLAPSDIASRRPLVEKMRGFLSRLSRHESSENALIQAAFQDDVSTGD